MKRLLAGLAVLLLCLLAVPAPVKAFHPFGTECGGQNQASNASSLQSSVCTGAKNSGGSTDPLETKIADVTELIAFIAGIAAVIVIIVGGIRYVASGGDSKSVSEAKNMVIYAAVGLVVIALGESIIVFVLSRIH